MNNIYTSLYCFSHFFPMFLLRKTCIFTYSFQNIALIIYFQVITPLQFTFEVNYILACRKEYVNILQ